LRAALALRGNPAQQLHPSFHNSISVNQSINAHFDAPICDFSVCFGFMHHVPMQKYRKKLLHALINQTRSGGYLVVTFWQFLNSVAIASKAQATTQRALVKLRLEELEKNDYILDWQDNPDAWRYCHNFSEEEIEELLESVSSKAKVFSQFSADGRTGNLNRYVVLRVL
jgi:hypothetical protein